MEEVKTMLEALAIVSNGVLAASGDRHRGRDSQSLQGYNLRANPGNRHDARNRASADAGAEHYLPGGAFPRNLQHRRWSCPEPCGPGGLSLLRFVGAAGFDIFLDRGHLSWVVYADDIGVDALLVTLVTLIGALGPARSAQSIEPVNAIRAE